MLPYIPMKCTRPIIIVTAPPTSRNILNAKASINGSFDLEGGVDRWYQLNIVQMQQISITADSQNENAPPPGPSSGIQPTGNSALFHIK